MQPQIDEVSEKIDKLKNELDNNIYEQYNKRKEEYDEYKKKLDNFYISSARNLKNNYTEITGPNYNKNDFKDDVPNAKKLEEENKDLLRKTQEEVQTILDDAKHQAKTQQEQIINDANVKANGLVQSAQAEIQQEKQRAISEINNRVSELSVLIASKVINKEISEQDQKDLVEKYIKEAGDK